MAQYCAAASSDAGFTRYNLYDTILLCFCPEFRAIIYESVALKVAVYYKSHRLNQPLLHQAVCMGLCLVLLVGGCEVGLVGGWRGGLLWLQATVAWRGPPSYLIFFSFHLFSKKNHTICSDLFSVTQQQFLICRYLPCKLKISTVFYNQTSHTG